MQFRIFCLRVYYLKLKDYNTQTYNFTRFLSFNLVSHRKRRKLTKGVWEQGSEKYYVT
jgi:hypothetical protein